MHLVPGVQAYVNWFSNLGRVLLVSGEAHQHPEKQSPPTEVKKPWHP